MPPRVAVRRLRGADALTVEIETNTLATKPLGQLAVQNVADLFALHERDDLPGGLKVRLRGFPERLGRAIDDLPDGGVFDAFLDELGEVPAEHVPTTLRVVIAGQAENRGPKAVARVEALVASWDDTEPEAFDLAAPKRAQQLPEGRRRKERLHKRAAGVADDTPKRTRSPAAPRTPRAVVPSDPARDAWIRQMVNERLAQAVDQGLLEAVLLAGVVHRARDRYPDLSKTDVKGVLRELERQGLARHSAGRWKRA